MALYEHVFLNRQDAAPAQVDALTEQYKALLASKGVDFTEHDATGNPELRQEMIAKSKGGMTFPQIFIGDTHVGGCDDLHALDRAGKLDALLAA